MTPHYSQVIRKLGIAEAPAALAITFIAILQYVFLIRLWKGYPLQWSGDAIDPNVVVTALSLSIGGAFAIVVSSLRHWSNGTASARRLERPASDRSFEPIHRRLADLASRSTLRRVPDLLYTSKNANALEVRHDTPGDTGAIVVGLDQRKQFRLEPDILAAKLGHELSHLELGSTRIEINARRCAILHFRVLGWLVCLFATVIGFINPRGIGSKPMYGGFEPVFSGQIYKGLLSQFAVLLLTSIIIFIYSYFFVIRREHIHDLRGSELADTNVLADRVFDRALHPGGLLYNLGDFFQLHPSAAARARVIRQRDMILLSAIVFPLVVGGIPGPLLQLLTAGWRDVFALETQWWNLGLTVLGGLLFYLVLSADLARLGLSAALGTRAWLRIPLYASCAGLATQLPRFILEIIYGWRHGLPPGIVIERIASGFLAGGARITMMITLSLLILAYLSAVRISAGGEAHGGRSLWLDRVLGSFILIGSFAVVSLRSMTFIFAMLKLMLALVLLRLLVLLAGSRCGDCGRRPWNALLLSTRCLCGFERLPNLRSFADGRRQHSSAASTTHASTTKSTIS